MFVSTLVPIIALLYRDNANRRSHFQKCGTGCTPQTRVLRFRFKNFFASKRNKAKRDPFRLHFARSREKNKKNFASFRFEFFASNQSEINKPYFRFVSCPKFFCFASFRFRFFRFASKRNEINVFSLCFALKRNELNIFFSLPFTSLGVDLKNWKADLNIFLHFYTDCPRISLYPFSLWSFLFFFVFLLHFIFIHFFHIEAKKISLPFRFILLRSENYGSFASFSFRFALLHFRFASDFYVLHRCETSEKSLFFASKRKKFRFRFALFRFEAKMTAHPTPETSRCPPRWEANSWHTGLVRLCSGVRMQDIK